MKAEPEADPNSYNAADEEARISAHTEKNVVADVMWKLRKHIYKFRNSRHWKVLLFEHIQAQKATPYSPQLDMPARWSSTYNMIDTVLKLEKPIADASHQQDFEESMRDTQLRSADWKTIKGV